MRSNLPAINSVAIKDFPIKYICQWINLQLNNFSKQKKRICKLQVKITTDLIVSLIVTKIINLHVFLVFINLLKEGATNRMLQKHKKYLGFNESNFKFFLNLLMEIFIKLYFKCAFGFSKKDRNFQ